jgi:hypothetical protein
VSKRNAKQPAEPVAYSEAVERGPILSSRPGCTTTVWRDGEVYRTDQFGRTRQRPSINPIPTSQE